MNKSIDDRLKDFCDSVYPYFKKQSEGIDFLSGIDIQYLDGELKFEKWPLEVEPDDKDISAFKSFAFLSSEEFKKWPDGKKVLAFQSYGAKYKGINRDDHDDNLITDDLINLGDYKALIKANPDWPPYLKAVSAYLIPEAELAKITFNDLEEIGFASWPAAEQEEFLDDLIGHNEKFLDGLDLDGLLKSNSFKNASDKAKIKLAKKFVKTVEDLDKLGISSPFEKLGLLHHIILDENENKFKLDFKTQDKFLSFYKSILEIDAKNNEKYYKSMEVAKKIGDENQRKAVIEKIEKDYENAMPTVEDIKKMSGFADLSPEEKFLVFVFAARELKISDFESIENLDKITDMSDFDRLFDKIEELNLASVLKSKLPLSIKTALFNNLEFDNDKKEKGEVVLSADQKKSAALRLVSYPYGTDLFFQKVLESDKNDVDKDLLQAESMLLETITAAQTLSKELGLEQADIEKLNALSKEIDENKSKPLEKRIGFLRKFGRILLNILEVPLSIFPLTFAKEARSWFFNPSRQMQYNDSKKQKEELGDILSRVKSQNKGQDGQSEEKEGGGEAVK